jgi:hypothetical protein
MLRVVFGQQSAPSWVLSEDEFLGKIDELTAAGTFDDVPAGQVCVEALDALDRVLWRAYYPRAADLAILARQIREERNVLAKRRA